MRFRRKLPFALALVLALIGCATPPVNPDQLPIYEVTPGGGGIPSDAAQQIANALGLPNNPRQADGALRFVDEDNFFKVPTKPASGGSAGEDGTAGTTGEGFDFDAIQKLPVMDTGQALSKVQGAFSAISNYLTGASPSADHATFEAVDAAGSLQASARLDTRVSYNFKLEGFPLLGPGAKAQVIFNGEGKVTSLNVAARALKKGPSTSIISTSEADRRAAEIYRAKNPDITALALENLGLAYYAPPLAQSSVKALYPHYIYGGTATIGGQVVNLLQILVPAISNTPKISLTVNADGATVVGQASVSGGTPPYSYRWTSSTMDLDLVTQGEYGPEITYRVVSREKVSSLMEKLTVEVTDANGLAVMASKTVQVTPAPSGEVLPQVGGVVDVGIERAVSDLGAANQSGFRNRILSEGGITLRFNWSGTAAWEKDFLNPPTGLDTTYVDNVDLTFYIGHGWGGGFTFEDTTHNDSSLTYTDASGQWWNSDLEWLALLSCQVLKDTHDGKKWWQRWGPAFNGLHLLLGFETNAYDWPNFGGRFADYMLGRNFGFTTITLPVRAAWIQAAAEEQPSSVVTVVMGVYGPGGLTSYNDFFHGQGAVSPDLMGSNIHGWWRVRVP